MTVEQFQTAASISEKLRVLNMINEELNDAINYVIKSRRETQTITLNQDSYAHSIEIRIPTSILNEAITEAKARIEVQIKDLNEQFKAL